LGTSHCASVAEEMCSEEPHVAKYASMIPR
jgi:hypothetical protein